MRSTHLLSIASGHSQTFGVFVRNSSLSFVRLNRSLSLHYVKPDVARARLQFLLKSIGISDAECRNTRIVLTLPGVSTQFDVERASDLLQLCAAWEPESILVADDTVSGLVADLESFDGLCAFSGTGASVFVGRGIAHAPSPVPRPFKKDGWGPLLGDYGSGFRLGLELVSWICRHVDLHGHPPDIFEQVTKDEPDLLDLHSAQNWFDRMLEDATEPEDAPISNWNMKFARLAKVVTTHVALNGRTGQIYDLLHLMAKQMANTICRAKDMAGCHTLDVICQGGMFRHSLDYFELVSEIVRSDFPGGEIRLARWHPVVGGLLLAATADWSLPAATDCTDLKMLIRSDAEAVAALYRCD